MWLIVVIDILVVGRLLVLAKTKGIEATLPFVAFLMVLMPLECELSLGVFYMTVQRLTIVVLLLVYLFSARRNNRRGIPLTFLMCASAVWTFISTLNSPVFLVSFKQLATQISEYYLLYYLVTRTVTTFKTVNAMLRAMVFAMVLCCIFGLCETYFHWSVLSVFPHENWVYDSGRFGPLVIDDRGIRIRATFPHAILFGAGIAMVVPMTLYILSQSKRAAERALLWCGVMIMFWAMYKTGSRGAWLMLVLSLALLALLNQKIRRPLLAISSLCTAVLVLRPGVWETLLNYYASTSDANTPMGASYNFRYALWQAVTKALSTDFSRTIWGYGLGTFRQLGLILSGPGIPEHRWFTCDSSWILLLYETGFVGLVITAALLLKPTLLVLRNTLKSRGPERELSALLSVNLVAYCFMMSSVSIYGWGQNGYMLWLVISLAVTLSKYHLVTAAKQAPRALMPTLEKSTEFSYA